MKYVSRLLVLLILSCPLSVLAEDTPVYDRVHFQAQASARVANDHVRAVLVAEGEGDNAASLADEINRTMNWALDRAADFDTVRVRTGTYQSWPKYYKNELRGWRSSQEIVVETSDFAAAGELTGVLQQRLQVRSMQFSVDPDTRSLVEDQLIQEALDRFKARALLVRTNMARSGYRIVDLNISSSAPGGRPVPMMRAMAAEAVSPAAVEGGDTTLSVVVNGSIELE